VRVAHTQVIEQEDAQAIAEGHLAGLGRSRVEGDRGAKLKQLGA